MTWYGSALGPTCVKISNGTALFRLLFGHGNDDDDNNSDAGCAQ